MEDIVESEITAAFKIWISPRKDVFDNKRRARKLIPLLYLYLELMRFGNKKFVLYLLNFFQFLLLHQLSRKLYLKKRTFNEKKLYIAINRDEK